MELRMKVKNRTHSLTPWCRVLLEQLTGLQLVNKFPAFRGTPKVHYRTHKRPPPVCILGQPNPVHIPTPHLLEIHLNIIHPSTSRSPQWSPSLWFPHQDPIQPLSSPIRATCLSPEQASRMWVFINKVFYREGLLAPRPNPKLEDHPSSAVCDCLFNLFAATLLIGGRSFIPNLRTRHAVVTGTQNMVST